MVAGGGFATTTVAVAGRNEAINVGAYGRPPADEPEGVERLCGAEVAAVSEVQKRRAEVRWDDRHFSRGSNTRGRSRCVDEKVGVVDRDVTDAACEARARCDVPLWWVFASYV